MDIFKFTNPADPSKMEQGQIVNNLKSKMWVERYGPAGEFTLIAPANSGIREFLPIGCFISHVDTLEIMTVENHEISDNEGTESDVKITGRGFETFFEQRVVGSNKTFPISAEPTDYILTSDYTWNQAVQLIKDHIYYPMQADLGNGLPYVEISSIVEGVSVQAERALKIGPMVYQSLLELLAIDNLGIKVVRPGPWSISGVHDTTITIHVGNDRTKEVIFSYDTGEIISADYLWSNKNLKDSALVAGKWVQTFVNPINPYDIGYKRRTMYVDGSSIDQAFETAPIGVDLDNVVALMQQLGTDQLSSQNMVVLTKAEIAKNAVKAKFRDDFDVGDLITVSGDYNEVSTMRVSEYVEIEDETGEVGYPTLSIE